MSRLVECVPNFSEGRNEAIIKLILTPFCTTSGVKLLDYRSDEDHNRTVVTIMGEPLNVQEAILASVGIAIQHIDLRNHRGAHPRMGAIDVVPFIPLQDYSILEAVELARETAQAMAQQFKLPVFLYERAASVAARENLANIRKGEFEGLAEKMLQPEWKPDFGPQVPHPSAGASAVGARMPLIAFNINLNTSQVEIAHHIARCIRHISGGLRYCKAMGVELKQRGMVQVSINLTDYTRTSLYRVFEMVKFEAERYGVQIVGSEIIGLTPMEALADAAAYYLRLEDFDLSQVIEKRMLE